MTSFGDFLPKKPFEKEARRRLALFKSALPDPDGKHCDDSIVRLMADYAADIWQEGYDEGRSEGYDDGYADAGNDA